MKKNTKLSPIEAARLAELKLMQGILAEYEANPRRDDILAFSTYHHAKRVLAKIEQDDAGQSK